MKTRIGLIDDHQLFLKSLSLMIESFREYEVVVEALNGKDLQEKLQTGTSIPEIMLIDVNMPVMDGVATARWLTEQHPGIKLVALSMNDEDKTIISMIRAGCCAYLLKDTHPTELEKALEEINSKGFYNGDASNVNYRRLIISQDKDQQFKVTGRELQFLELVCSDRTYKQIALEMGIAERTVDGYREAMFEKFKVASRVGLCLEAIRKNLVRL
ncbi:MAG: response regulator transcription factor [Chitinophagaceae bacterium]|nr:MAG: response regulator transcription factor [Chitinophagaceae bacterium]